MRGIQINNPQGYAYDAKWNGGISFPITDSCERIANVMGEDCVRLVFKLPNKVVFDAFAYIVYNGQTFFLKEQYIPTPDGTFQEDSGEISTAYFSYDVKFVSVGNMLDKFICYRHVKVTNVGEWDEPEININGNLETLYVIIMGSIQQASNRLKAQYGQLYFADLLDTIVANGLDGNMPNTENVKLTVNTNLLTFNFSGDNIANVCTTVANSFTNDDKKDTEWYIVENNGSLTLHFAKCVDIEYGVQYVSDYISNNNSADSSVRPQKSGGLKKVEYSQAWSGITNVIVPYGSTRNMSYQAAKGIDEITQMQSTFGKRLRLVPNTSYNVKDKEGNVVIITTDSHGAIRNNYVDTGIEQVKFYDEIYPQGHFRVTSVETKNKRQDGEIVPEYTVSGIAIDSKGNEIQPAEGFYPISIEEGTTLSVRFEKGLLNGREFEIANKTRKDEGATTYSLKFTIVADGSIEDGTLIPSGNFIPREGDEFALFNMKMPEVYITAAQQELAQRAYDELVELQTSRPQVKCTTDPTTWDKPIALGYQFKVMSELFNSEDSFISRVTSYSYKLTKPYDVQFTLASAIMQGTLSQMNDLISDVTHQAGGLEQRAINLSRRGWRDAAEMAEMVDSLAADMMLVGNEKYQFAFTAGIEIVNSNNQTTAIKIGEGTLQHTQDPYISDYTCQGWWSHGAVTLNNGHTENGSASLVSLPDTPFYLYAVVGQNSDNISFELQDKEQDGEAYLLLGILSSAFTDTIDGVTTNYRVFNRTNGYTQISGGTITTEQIQDAGRNLIIDFQSNPPRIIARNGAEIIGNIKFKASDEMTAEEQLAALGIGVGNAQSTAGAAAQAAEDAKKQAAEEAAQIRKDYAAAIAESEDKMTEALAASVVEINGGIEALQKQVDGEVNSWFMEGEPTTTNKPASDWTGTDENGVAFDYRQRHEGDTYTNINNATNEHLDNPDIWENGSSTSESGKSYDAVKTGLTTRIRTKELLRNNKSPKKIKVVAGYSVVIRYFDENKIQTTGSSDTWLSEFTLNPNYPYFALAFRKNDNSNITIDVLKSFTQSIFTVEGAFDYDPTAGQSWRWCNVDDEYGTGWHWHKIADSDAVKALQEAAKASAAADGKSKTFVVKPTNYAVGDLWILQSDTDHADGKKGDMLTANAASDTYNAAHWSKEIKYTDDTAVENLEIGVRNLWAKKYMMDWNDTYAGCATKGSDEYGEYIQIKESDIWTNIANRNQTTDIFNGKITFEPNKQYYFKAKWRNASSTPSTYGVSFRFVYTDGTVELFGVYCNSAEPIVVAKASNPNKSVKNIGFDYSSSTARTRIYEIQLVQATKQPNDWLVAPEDVDAAIANLEVGGTNLLDNSKVEKLGDWSGDSATITFDESTNSIKGVPNGNYPRIKNASVKDIGFVVGKYYTISMDMKANAVATRSAYVGNNSGSVVALNFGTFSVSTSWNRIKLTAICRDHDANVAAFGLYIYCGTQKANDKTEFLQIRNIKLEEGKLATSWSPSVADTEAEIRAAESKAEALDYLKTALTDGSTEIAGGLTMTNVLMLKNLAGSVTAGMSGLTTHENKEDKVLMWGGGTYEEAYAAANSNTYNTGSGTITTLLKKDGTGKIGIFKISDTQAVVDVPNQGKVIIDASTTNGGIRVLNSSGRINAALLPTSISSFKPLTNNSVTGSEQSVYYSMSTQSVTSTSKTIALSRTGSFTTSGTTTETLEQYTKETTITTASTKVGGNTVTLNGSIRTSNHDMFVRVTCELLYNGNSIYSINHTEEVQVGYNYISLSNVQLSFPNSITKALTVSNSINMQLKVTVTITGASSGAYIDAVSLNVSMGSIYMFYKATTAVTYTYPPQTIIGSDGLISLVSNSKYFMVDNSGSTQKIYAKGLQATKPTTTGNGELYVSNYLNTGLVKALYDGFSAISEVLEKCKYEGSNAKAQENAKNACANIRTQLAAISIIANS